MELRAWAEKLGGFGEFPVGDENYDINEVREAYILRVQQGGLRVVLPEANQLQIDIDSEEHLLSFMSALGVILRNWDTEGIDVEAHPSKSGLPRLHITLTLPFEVSPWQRIALQAALGSDPTRELLSATRLMRGDSHPTLFVEAAP